MEVNSTLFAFYGSLRKNMPLYDQFRYGLNYKFSSWISGYQLFSLGDFPCAVKSGKDADKMLIEIFEITDQQVVKEIDDIEIGYGYYRDEVEIDGVRALIYLFKDAANYPPVLQGDWVKFFRSKR
jgi:gamma-glutamylcyclotransferase (GGCT)/AIG2-like uncharacterized protein YtfP